jgi:hypothetical protein
MSPETALLAELREQLAAAGAPAEVLAAFDGLGDTEQVMGRLAELGVLPGPERALGGLLEQWKPLLSPGTSPLDVELAGLEFLQIMRTAAPNADELPAMLSDLAAQAEETADPAALALLRFLAALGPAEVRAIAGEAADRMIACGLTDRPWAAKLGKPKVSACFGYGGAAAGQESIALSFTYGRKTHAIVVLIDHDLGGGVKDCFPTDQPGVIRSQFERMASLHDFPFREYRPHEAHAIMVKALGAPLCPAQPDQVEDVGTYLGLLRSRVDLLSAKPSAKPGKATVHKVKVTLRGAKPPIWRRLEIDSRTSLADMHGIIQNAFGWLNYHLWVFETPVGDYGLPDPELGHLDASGTTLQHTAPNPGDRILYTYDFGDSWDHDILVEDVSPAAPDVGYPRCLTGRRACPPEDCGGIWGYADLLNALADPGHEEHERFLEWLSLDSADDFDPARFDLAEVNRRLSRRP